MKKFSHFIRRSANFRYRLGFTFYILRFAFCIFHSSFFMLSGVVLISRSNQAHAQAAPQSFNYQLIARDTAGLVLSNKTIGIQISILKDAANGTVVYSEQHSATTNNYGLVNLGIGAGGVVSGNFSSISWGDFLHFLKLEIDPSGGTNYFTMGTTQLVSVPYSLYAAKAGNVVDTSNTNELQALSISSDTIYLTNGGFIKLPAGFDGDYNSLANKPTNVSAFTNDANYLTTFTEVDGSVTNELQALSISNDTIYLSNGGFVKLPSAGSSVWAQAGNNIYNTNSGNVGIGTNAPAGKLIVKGNMSAPATEPLFEVKNKDGEPVFVVYPDSVHIYVTGGGATKAAAQGGFAVSGRSSSKSDPATNYLIVTPDSTRIYTGDTIAGFGVQNIGASSSQSYMQLTPSNYFIGHLSGQKINVSQTTGYGNAVIGYHAGQNLTTGYSNSILGYESGQALSTGALNVFVGAKAGYKTISGSANTAVGDQALFNNTSGDDNVAIGINALRSNTSGSNNIAIGAQSLYSNTTGSNNSACGMMCLQNNTTGQSNSAIGIQVLMNNTIGGYNTALGDHAMTNNTEGAWNVALGASSLNSNTTGSYNIAIGYSALFYNQTGQRNLAVGNFALQDNTTGADNIAFGLQALSNSTSGNRNTAIGNLALLNNNGSYNIAMGDNALLNNLDGNNNVAIGNDAMYGGNAGNNNIALGFECLRNSTADNVVAIGYRALEFNTTGASNTALGYSAAIQNTTGAGNTALGYGALEGNTNGNYNIAIGYNSFSASAPTGNYNIAIGTQSLKSISTGNYNIGIGYYALRMNMAVNSSIGIGNYTLYSNTTGAKNIAVGDSSLYSCNGQHDNLGIGYAALKYGGNSYCVAVGNYSLYENGGTSNVALGYYSCKNNYYGDANTAIGDSALISALGSWGSENTAVGNGSLVLNDGDYNTAVGSMSLKKNTIGTHNVAVGYNAGVSTGTYSNTVAVGSKSVAYNKGTSVGYGATTSFTGATAIGYGAVASGIQAMAIGYNSSVAVDFNVTIGNATTAKIGGYVVWSVLSDGRFKKNINENVPGLAFIKKLRPVTYQTETEKLNEFIGLPADSRDTENEKKSSQIIRTGFIAQEVEQAANELGFDFDGVDKPANSKDHYGLRYAEFVVPIVKAVQEQQQQIEALKADNELLKTENNELKILVAKIKALEEKIELLNVVPVQKN